MFTGIVQSLAEVFSVKNENSLSRIGILVDNEFAMDLNLGASIAINGVCLTVVLYRQHAESKVVIFFDVINESLRVTNLSDVKAGCLVNFERSLKVGDEIGGHHVSGHIHDAAIIKKIEKTSTNCSISFEMKSDYIKYIFNKGFVAINGISLTVGDVSNNVFTVHLIPETVNRTNLGICEIGQKVNIECDQQTITIVNTIERMNLTVNK